MVAAAIDADDGAIRRAIVRLIDADIEAIAGHVVRRQLDLRGLNAEGGAP
jgi:hypothetical protein